MGQYGRPPLALAGLLVCFSVTVLQLNDTSLAVQCYFTDNCYQKCLDNIFHLLVLYFAAESFNANCLDTEETSIVFCHAV